MNKLRPSFLGTVLVVAFAAAPATMAEDFHALSQLSTGFTAMPEDQLASIEGTGARNCVNRSCRGSARAYATATATATATGTGGSATNNNTNTNTPRVCTISAEGLVCI